MGNMIKKVSILFSIIFSLLAVFITSYVNADKIIHSSTKNVIKPGDEFKITLKLDEDEKGGGYQAYKAVLVYDEDIFETVEQEDFKSLNEWKEFVYNPETKELVAVKTSAEAKEEEVVEVSLHVKKEVNLQNTFVGFKEIAVSSGKEVEYVDDFIEDVIIAGNNGIIDNEGTGNDNSSNNNNGTVNNEGTENNNVSTNNSGSSNNITSTNNGSVGNLPLALDKENSEESFRNDNNITNSLPLTPNDEDNTEIENSENNTNVIVEKQGLSYNKILILAIIVIILVIIIWKIRKSGLKLSKKQLFILFLFGSSLLITKVSLVVNAEISKGDINNNNLIDYEDIRLLERHLVHLDSLDENGIDSADMNNDGILNIQDLSLLVKKVERLITYEVSIEPELDSYFVEKDRTFEFKFSATVNPEENVESIVVNGYSYNVHMISPGSYSFDMRTPSNSQKIEYEIESVTLSNGKNIEVGKKVAMEILKEMPSIENFTTEDIVDEGKVKVRFNIKDEDKSFTAGTISIVDDKNEEIESHDVVVGENEFSIPLEEGRDYKLVSSVRYDLTFNSIENYESHVGSIVNDFPIKLVIDYGFNWSDIKLYNDSKEEQYTFEKNDGVWLGFKSSNLTSFKPEKVTVDGKEYYVEEENDTFYANIESPNIVGQKSYTLEKIQLNNGKVFELNRDNIVTMTVLKESPSVENVNLEESQDKNQLTLELNWEDEDSTLQKALYSIKNSNNEVVWEKETTDKEINETIDVTDQFTNTYLLEIKATYALVEGQNIEEAVYTSEINAKTKVIVESANISKEHVEKGEEFSITYKVKSNKSQNITSMIVSRTGQEVDKVSENTYRITGRAGNSAGKYAIELSSLVFEDGEIVQVNNSVQVEVLKSKPIVSEYHIEEDYINSTVEIQFDLLDEDNSFIAAKATLKEKGSIDIAEKEIDNIGNQSLVFNVEDGKEYILNIIANYKKDEAGDIVEDNEVIFENSVQLVVDYNLDVNNMKTLNAQGNETSYFAKGEDIVLQFISTNKLSMPVQKVKVNGNEYNVISKGDDLYEVKLPAVQEARVESLNIEEVILSNLKDLPIEGATKNIEILKDEPTVESFSYEVQEDKNITMNINILDEDSSATKLSVVVTDEYNEEVLRKEDLRAGENEITFNSTNSEIYSVKIYADYDLDFNTIDTNSNIHENVLLDTREIEDSPELLEFKDITSVELFKNNGSRMESIESINVSEFNPEEYIAKVNMEKMPSFYAEVESSEVVEDKFILQLKVSDVVQYDGDKKSNVLRVTYGDVKNNIVTANITFEDLINKIKENPNAEIYLGSDLDASSIAVRTNSYIENFRGKLYGNGYTIKNLSKPLFEQLENATIENIVIENSEITGSNSGILANRATNSTITNVHINNSSINVWHNNGTGSFLGIAENSTRIEACSANNIFVQSNKRVGGFVGYLNTGSIIENSYIKGTVKAGNDAVGGMIGQTSGAVTLQNSYADVTLDMSVNWAVGGLVGYSSGNNITLKNNISLATGNQGTRVIGSSTRYNNNSDNNYEIQESTLISNINGNKVKVISKSEINEDFLKDTLNWDEEVWNLTGVTGENMPSLNNADPNNEEESVKPQNDTVYIPEFERISKLESYNSDKEIAYHNINILMPFYDAKLIVEYGNKIENDENLNNKRIKYIFAYDNSGEVVQGINENTYSSLRQIRIVFEDDTYVVYDMNFYKKTGSVAAYKIPSLDILYNFNKYISVSKDSLIDELYNEAVNWQYTDIVQPIIDNPESRLYTDHYNEVLKGNLREIIRKIIDTQANYTMISDNNMIEMKIKQDLLNNDTLKKILYTYNYFDRWYGFNIGGLKLGDFIFFDGQQMNQSVNINYLLNKMQLSSKRATSVTEQFYNTELKALNDNKTLKEFLEMFIKTVGETEDPGDWFSENFKGMLYEAKPEDRWLDYGYRGWDILNRRENWILPLLSMPTEDMYIITTVGHIYLGTGNLYNEYKLQNGETDKIEARNRILAKMKDYGDKYAKYYSLMLGTVEHPEIMKTKATIQYDTKGFKYQDEGDVIDMATTQEPVFKNFHHALGIDWNNMYAAAYANGHSVYWCVHYQLDDYRTSTHESVHNEDGSFLFGGHGRRSGSNAEWYTNKVNTQEFSDEMTVYNFTYEFDYTDEKVINMTTERVNTPEKLESFYKNMFETLYVLDYIEAQALLELTPEEQAYIIEQYNWDGTSPTEKTINDIGVANGNSTISRLTEEQLEAMNLQSIEDLYDYRIVMNRNNTSIMGSIYLTYWYLPHYNDGVGDYWAYTFMGKEMLGYAGWVNGYVPYASAQYNKDLLALQNITGYNSFKEYKMARYENVKNNLNNVTSFDTNLIKEEFVKAFKEDVKNQRTNNQQSRNLRRVIYNNVKRVTDDFRTSVYEPVRTVSVSNAQELLNALNEQPTAYIVLNNDIDMSEINTDSETYVNTVFAGTLNGNGHSLNNVTKTLFNSVKFATICDLTIKNPRYPDNVNAAIAKRGDITSLSGVKIENSPYRINYFANSNIIFTMNGTSTSVEELTISTVEDFRKIEEYGKNKTYKLAADIDMSSYRDNTPVITGEFTGELIGAGYTLSNLSQSLFENLKGKVENLRIENATIGASNKSNVGILAGETNNAVVNNIKLNNITVDGRDNVASLVGISRSSNFSRISADNITVTGHRYYAGGLIGRSFDSKVYDVAIQGRVNIKDTHNGGLIGAINRDRIERAYVNVDVTRTSVGDSRNKNAGLYGALENGAISIKDVVVKGNVSDTLYKITPATTDTEINDIAKYLINVYEYNSSQGISNISDGNTIESVNEDTLKDVSFYTDTLGWSNDVWDFSNLDSGEGPQIK